MNTDTFKKTYIARYKKMNRFYSLQGRGLLIIFQKIKLVGIKYILLQLYRFKLLSDKVFTKTFLGNSLYVSVLDAGNQNFFLFGIPARKEAPLVLFLLNSLKSGDVFYDVGANYGIFTALAETCIDLDGEIHSFEPNKNLTPYLEKTIKSFKNNSITHSSCALGNIDGLITFYDYLSALDSSVSSIYEQEGGVAHTTYDVPIFTLDTYVLTRKKPTVLKVDIESAEFDFLQGASKFLTENNPTLILEFKLKSVLDKANSQKCLDFLTALQYLPHSISYEGQLESFNEKKLSPHVESAVSYENIVFLKKL
jgi:FkbM family methyltransferase